MINYILISKRAIAEAKETVEFYDFYVIIPYSNSQAHRLADRCWVPIYYVNNVENVKRALRIYKEKVNEKPEDVAVNKPIFRIADHDAIIEKTNEYEIIHYSGDALEGYIIRVGDDYIDVATVIPL
ncbi:MAG: hypothetical protein DRJ60_00135 [Thermoprotei archaeon]|nr:MAG: hypothetical protein DRJ60_00135 [Thermoprotei archaeon]